MEKKDGMISTENKMGCSMEYPDKYIKSYIDFTLQNTSLKTLDIGCGHGVAVFPLIQNGCDMVAVDIESKHLQYITGQIKENNKLHLLHENICNIEFNTNQFRSILCSRVLHFIDSSLISELLHSIYSWLLPGGRFYITCDTPFAGYIKNAYTLFEQNKDKKWPYEIKDVRNYLSSEWGREYMPDYINLFDQDILYKLLISSGFRILNIGYYTCFTNCRSYKNNGMETIGAIVKKR